MRYIGLFFIILAALFISSAYRAALAARCAALEAFLALATHIRSRVSGYLEPPEVWASGFSAENDGVERMLGRIRSGEGVYSAYTSVRDGLSLSREAKELVGAFFKELGRDAVEIERKSMDGVVDKLSVLLDKERDECSQRGRVAAVMALMLSAGGAILII